MIELENDIVINCPRCGKVYNMDEYKRLEHIKTYPQYKLIGSVRGKNAPKEALREISYRTGGVLYDEHVDIYRKVSQLHDVRKCSKCDTEFGFVKIIGEDKGSTIYQIDLDLVTPK